MTQYIINVRATQDLSEISEYLAGISLERSDRFFRISIVNAYKLSTFLSAAKAIGSFVLIYEG